MHLQLEHRGAQPKVFSWVLSWTQASVCLVLGFSLFPGPSFAAEQDIIEAGKHEFQRSCATCHGIDAKGDGPTAEILLAKPADLTQLSKKRGGKFLFWRVYEKIDGSDEDLIREHGSREMPIWGEEFRFDRKATAAYNMGVRGRILSLVHYLESIQEK